MMIGSLSFLLKLAIIFQLDIAGIQISDSTDQHDSTNCFIGSPSTTVEFELLERDSITVNIYDKNGKYIKQISKEFLYPGKHEITNVSNDLPSGAYYVIVKSSRKIIKKKRIIVLK
ncbi:MAG: T9SS type A sorting domain-containing protein [Ignavibacteria bacterium]|jgi:hypothetical protein